MTTAAPKSLLPKAMSAAPPPPLLLTIRFNAALPDLELDIPRPSATTVVSLKHLIRSRLDKAHARRRLRFIHGGKILPDTAVLSSVLRALPPPPPPPQNGPSAADAEQRRRAEGDKSGRSKGKSVPGRPEPAPRIYVNCSTGDELSVSELESEAQAAALPPPTSSSSLLHPSSSTTTTTTTTPGLRLTTAGTTTTTAPRGFERLLSAGFTGSEVNQLRLQFRSIHSSRYTPDTLPSPDSFRRMEDSWIDDNGAAMPTAATNAGADGTAGADSNEVGLVGMVDLLIRGVITGFIWPLGSAGWLIREESMSSDRWRFMVRVGVMFGVLIGFIRAISGDSK